MLAPADIPCTDNCGTTIKQGEKCHGVRNFYDGQWHKAYRCTDCQFDMDEEERLENIIMTHFD